jgi:hypothetical protein
MTKIHSSDAVTGEEVLKDMTEAEEENYQNILAQAAASKKAVMKAESDKAALLAKLGITAEEAQLLIS